MLVLSRKQGERIIIGDGIEVVILKTQGDRVRLGFIAPAQVRINRLEVAKRIKLEEAHHRAHGESANVLASLSTSEDQTGSCRPAGDKVATA